MQAGIIGNYKPVLNNTDTTQQVSVKPPIMKFREYISAVLGLWDKYRQI
jgi:hypothetical protein